VERHLGVVCARKMESGELMVVVMNVGFTVILDAKFYEDYSRNKMLYPEWFRESFDGVVY